MTDQPERIVVVRAVGIKRRERETIELSEATGSLSDYDSLRVLVLDVGRSMAS